MKFTGSSIEIDNVETLSLVLMGFIDAWSTMLDANPDCEHTKEFIRKKLKQISSEDGPIFDYAKGR